MNPSEAPLCFLGDRQTGKAEKPSLLETGAKIPQFLLKITKFDPLNLNVSVSSRPQLALVNETSLWHIATEMYIFRTSLTGLSALLRDAIVIIYSRGVLQPPGIRRFGNGVSQLSPLRPVFGNGDPLIEFLQNALAIERVLRHPAPSLHHCTQQS